MILSIVYILIMNVIFIKKKNSYTRLICHDWSEIIWYIALTPVLWDNIYFKMLFY